MATGRILLSIGVGLLCFASSFGQDNPSTEPPAPQDSTLVAERVHRTTVWAACVPGAGQIANRKFWKAPIVWAALAWSGDYWLYNLRQFKDAKTYLRYETDEDPFTINPTSLNAVELEEAAISYRRQRDLAVMGMLGIHLLSILDANVDAHLTTFDVSPDLKAAVFCEPFAGTAGIRLTW